MAVQQADGQPETDWAADLHAAILNHPRRCCLSRMKKRWMTLCNEGLTGSSSTNVEALSAVCVCSCVIGAAAPGDTVTSQRVRRGHSPAVWRQRWRWPGSGCDRAADGENILTETSSVSEITPRIKDGCFLPHPDLLSFLCFLKFFTDLSFLQPNRQKKTLSLYVPANQICFDFTCHFEIYVVTALCSWSGFCLSAKAFCYDQEHIMFRLKIPGFVAINTAGNVLMPSINV